MVIIIICDICMRAARAENFLGLIKILGHSLVSALLLFSNGNKNE